MASRSPDKPALAAAYRKLTGDTRTRVLRHAQQQWAGMDSWSDSAADQLVAQLLPVVLGGQRVVAGATAAFLRTWLDVPGSRTTTLLDLEQVTGTALRGVDPAIVYRRPVIESRATFAKLRKAGKLDRQQVIDAAIDTGLRRLLGTASTDLQLTATLTSQQVLKAEKVKVYRRVTRPGACPLCLAASDRVYHVADLLPIHANCVPADTVVQSPGTLAATRRWFEGEVVVMRTARGNELRVTPNHPVLTPQGWVGADRIRLGQDVFDGRGLDWMQLGVPDPDDEPALIGDVFEALKTGGLRRVEMSAQDFHGDGSDGNVDVVFADRLLRGEVSPETCQVLLEELFSVTGGAEAAPGLDRLRPSAQLVPGGLPPTNGVVGSGGLGLPVLGGHALYAQTLRRGVSPQVDASALEFPDDDGAAYVELLRQCEDADASRVLIGYRVGQRHASRVAIGVPVTPGDSSGVESVVDGLTVHAQLGRNLAAGFAGQVQRDRVVHIERVPFAGHVYDLQTSRGWFSADGVIVSNCHCIVVPGGVLPEALQRAGNDQDPTGGRGLQIGQNGEIGPVLEWGDKTKGAGHRHKRSKTPSTADPEQLLAGKRAQLASYEKVMADGGGTPWMRDKADQLRAELSAGKSTSASSGGAGSGGIPPAKPPVPGATPDPPEGPRLTGADAAQHLQRQLLPYMHSLPEPIQAAVKSWYDRSADIQAVARGQVLRVGHRVAQRHRLFLREAILRAPPVAKPLTLWRGASTREGEPDWAILGFYASSTGKNIAERFAADSGGVVYQVDVDPGVRGLWLRFQGKHGDQYEFLVDESTRIVRIDVQHVRLVPDSGRR